MSDNGSIVSGSSNDSGEHTNWNFEDAISRYDDRLGKLVGRGVAAEYRCRTCHRRASQHPGKNVKGCRMKAIEDDAYIEDLELQLSDLKTAVTMIQESHQAQSELRSTTARLTEIELSLSSISSRARLLIEGFNRYESNDASWDDVRPLLVDLGFVVGETVGDRPADTGSSPESSPKFSHRRRSLIRCVKKRPTAPVRTVAVDNLDDWSDDWSMSGASTISEQRGVTFRSPASSVIASSPTPGASSPTPGASSPTPIASSLASHLRSAAPHAFSRAPPTLTPLRTDPPRGHPPGLEDESGPVIHETDGAICGGKPDSKFIAKVLSSFPVEFKNTDDAFSYLTKRRTFMVQLKSTMPNETAYTMISLFTTKAQSLYTAWEPLLGKKEHFTSFSHFLREFEERRFPDLSSAAFLRFRRCRQEMKGESVRLYWLRFEDLARVVGIDPSTHMTPFINGVKSKLIRAAIRVEWSRTHDAAKVIELADQMEMGDEMERLREEELGREKPASAASISASNDAAGNATGGGRPRPGKRHSGKFNSTVQRPSPHFSTSAAASPASPASASSSSGAPRRVPSTPAEMAATRLASQ